MQTVNAKLSAKYLYVRCDGDFILQFSNGSYIPFWKGFYCILSDDLKKYNSNGGDCTVVCDDGFNVWWLSSDTLIMSVTDINTDLISIMTNQNNVQNDILNNLLEVGIQNRQLLASLQNSMSTFLNAYVESNSIQDYGFQTANIGDDGVCNLYIAKPSSVNKYHFNCKITHSGYKSGSWLHITDSTMYLPGRDLYVYDGLIAKIVSNGGSGMNAFPELIGKNRSIVFNIYDNSNQLLSGYVISNVSVVSRLVVSGSLIKSSTHGGSVFYTGFSFDNGVCDSVSFSSGSFSLASSLDSVFDTGGVSGDGSVSIFESLEITFDVAKT